MAYEMIVGLQVKDAELYRQYRQAMTPLLETFGGGFRYDFWTKETLKSETPEPINRIFAIYFKDKFNMDSFFSHPEYKIMKQKFFESSVTATTIIASYER